MMLNPHIVFAIGPRRSLVARSGWEQEEARAVLRDLGWEWEEELHALIPPGNVSTADAGIQAVEELHRHGHLAGYVVGPYGTMLLNLRSAEQVFTRLAVRDTSVVVAKETPRNGHQPASRQRTAYGLRASRVEPIPAETSEGPAI